MATISLRDDLTYMDWHDMMFCCSLVEMGSSSSARNVLPRVCVDRSRRASLILLVNRGAAFSGSQ